MNHPAFIPAALIVDHEEVGDICKYINESPRIVWICWQTRLWFHNQTYGTKSLQAAICFIRCCWSYAIIDPWKDGRKDIRLKPVCVEQVILKQHAGFVGFRKSLYRQRRMRPLRQSYQPVFERSRQAFDVYPICYCLPFLSSILIWMAFLLRVNSILYHAGENECKQNPCKNICRIFLDPAFNVKSFHLYSSIKGSNFDRESCTSYIKKRWNPPFMAVSCECYGCVRFFGGR